MWSLVDWGHSGGFHADGGPGLFRRGCLHTEALAGNPLAVVMNTCGLTTEQMQAIAREFNLSETTFVERREAAVEQAEGVRVRIFTTQEELPLRAIQRWARRAFSRSAPETVQNDTVTLAKMSGRCRCALSRAEGSGPALDGTVRRDDAAGSGVWRGAGCGGSGAAHGLGSR